MAKTTTAKAKATPAKKTATKGARFITERRIKKYGAKVRVCKDDFGRDATQIRVKGGADKQTLLWNELHKKHGDKRAVCNYKDSIVIEHETNKQKTQRMNREKEKFVKDALASGRYKGTTEEKAKSIFMDSPYSIHSARQIEELVKKHEKKATPAKKAPAAKKATATKKAKRI